LWAEATAYAVYVLNRIVNRKDGNVSPYELWTGKTPDLSNLKTFGSDAYIHVPKFFRRKWDKKAERGIFVGFQVESGNMRVYLPTTKAIKESKDVIIHEGDVLNDGKEHKMQVKIPVNDDVIHNQTIEEDDNREPINEQVSDKQVLRRSQRQRPPERYEAHWAAIEEPKTYVEAVTGTDKGERRYKARLVARGFSQTQGVDYQETFSPVVRYDSLRVLLALVAQHDLEMTQFNVKTAFLYGELKEEIYMKIPDGLEINNDEDHILKLEKSLYGLKQASRC